MCPLQVRFFRDCFQKWGPRARPSAQGPSRNYSSRFRPAEIKHAEDNLPAIQQFLLTIQSAACFGEKRVTFRRGIRRHAASQAVRARTYHIRTRRRGSTQLASRFVGIHAVPSYPASCVPKTRSATPRKVPETSVLIGGNEEPFGEKGETDHARAAHERRAASGFRGVAVGNSDRR